MGLRSKKGEGGGGWGATREGGASRRPGGELETLTDVPTEPDVAAMATGLGVALHTAGLPVGPDRCERLARAVTVMGAPSPAELRACPLATLVADPGHMATVHPVVAAPFGGPAA